MSAEPDPPSARAVERLATGVGEDVADLRAQLHQALERADRLEADGRQDLAIEVLDQQRDALLEVHRRLEGRLAQAAVEREAERVVDAAAVGSEVAADGGGASFDEGLALRLVASAAAAVLGVTLLLSPGSGTGGVTAAGSSLAGDTAADAHHHDGDAAPGRAEAAAPDGAGGPVAPSGPPALAGGTSDAARPTELRALPIPEAHILAARSDEDDEDGAGLTGLTGPLAPPDPGLEQLTTEAPDLPESEGDDEADEGDGDADSDDEAEPADDGESELLGR